MIRKATQADVDAVALLYDEAIDYEDTHVKYTSWQKGIYPTADTARLGLKKDSLYVFEENGNVLASVILDNRQPPEYKNIGWNVVANPQEILVIHTLCVSPKCMGSGIGSAIIDFAKAFAKESGCLALRLNTTATNSHALHLYEKNGFSVVASHKILLNGQIACAEHVFLEYTV